MPTTQIQRKHRARRSTIGRAMLADHHEISALFDELLAAFRHGERDDAAAAFARFEKRLEAHLAFEDELLLPALRRINPAEADALAADHQRIRAELTELGIGVDLHLTRASWVAAFVEMLRAHAEREDRLLYRWADTLPRAEAAAALRRLSSS